MKFLKNSMQSLFRFLFVLRTGNWYSSFISSFACSFAAGGIMIVTGGAVMVVVIGSNGGK